MQTISVPLTRDLVLAGGGHAHAVFLRMWAMKPLSGVRVTVINPDPVAPYTGMLPGVVAGHYSREEADLDIWRLARCAGASLVLDRVTGLDPDAHLIQLENRPPLSYDVASLNIGITTPKTVMQGAEHVHPVKPMSRFLDSWDGFLNSDLVGNGPVRLAVIGAGAGGVELSLALHHRLTRETGQTPDITLIEQSDVVLSGATSSLRHRLLTELRDRNIKVLIGRSVKVATASDLTLDDGSSVPSDFTVSAAGAQPADWLHETGLALNANGYVRVDRSFRSLSHPDLYAVGDIAHFESSPRPKAGVYAVRAGKVLHDNLTSVLKGDPPRPHKPQSDYLKMISLGDKRAVGERGGFSVSGGWVWQWKNWIDQRFMARHNDLSPMTFIPPDQGEVADGVDAWQDQAPLCAGCGSKLAQAPLDLALQTINPPRRSDVLTGPGDDAAVLTWGETAQQVLTTDHFRAFTDDTYVLGQIAANHALGDIWAMGAKPQGLLVSVILPAMSDKLHECTIQGLMAGVQSVCDSMGADILGGHTSQGAELTIGISATGLIKDKAITQSGLKPGDALIMTKPIGTGVALAAEMRGLASGPVLAKAYASMQRLSAKAAEILSPHAHAMTDVTGFGLAGHLVRMCQASGVSAELSLSAIPVLSGVQALSERGIQSSIVPSNKSVEAVMKTDPEVASSPVRDLLFDPQTAGGLLAGVDRGQAADLILRLQAVGHDARIIGQVRDSHDLDYTLFVKA